MELESILIASLIVSALLLIIYITYLSHNLNLNHLLLYIPLGLLVYTAIIGMRKFNTYRNIDNFTSNDTKLSNQFRALDNSDEYVSGGIDEYNKESMLGAPIGGSKNTKQWNHKAEERKGPSRPRLPFKRALQMVSPEFKSGAIKHPSGFDMTLIDESKLFGGSKQRALLGFIADIKHDELVYAGPSTGYAQIAIAYCCLLTGKSARIFVDATDSRSAPLSMIAREFGAIVVFYESGSGSADEGKFTSRLKQIQKRAEIYVDRNSRNTFLLPFGMDSPAVRDLYEVAFEPLKRFNPKRIWIVAGSGMIFSVLARIWPDTEFLIVQVGKTVWPDQLAGIKHQLFISPYAFSERIKEVPPYNTLMNYDAKVWPFILKHGAMDDFIWNTAGEPMDMNIIRAHVGRVHLLLDEAKREEDGLVIAAGKMSMPMFHDAMPSAKEMFSSLKSIAREYKSSEIVSRNFSRDYTKVDGLSNHFTEDVRMDCIVNRSDKISPKNYWRRYHEQIAREAYWQDGQKPSPLEWRDAMNAIKCYECGTFNPIILINAIKRYFNEPIMLLDPSSGWGDRLIGALACDVALYAGFDPNKHLHPGYARIKTELAPMAKTVFIPEKYSNAFLPSDLLGKFDMAFTSPPFFDEEIYVGSETDVTGSYADWLRDIYTPYLQDMTKAVKQTGVIAVYIDNVPRVANMANDTTRILNAAGFASLETLLFRNDSVGINGLLHPGHPRSLWVFKRGRQSYVAGGSQKPDSLAYFDEMDDIADSYSGGLSREEKSPYPAIQEYSTTMDDEITRLDAVDKMLNFVTREIQKLSKKQFTGKKIEYETRNIVERLLLACANHAALVKADDPVFTMNETLKDHFKADVVFKYPDISPAGINAIVIGVAQIVDNFLHREKSKRDFNGKISYRGTMAMFNLGNYRREIAAARMKMLVTRAGEQAVVKMLARYATIISGSQHWEAPLHYFKVLYALGVRFEGFSSPINSQFIRPEFKDTRICTLFPDTDAPFGSIGGFFQVDFLSYWRPDFVPQIVVGPPYYDELILQIARRVIDHCDRAVAQSKKIRFIITHSNSWDFSEGFRLLKESKYKRVDHVYPSGEHFYNNDRGEQVIARFSTRMFMLDAGMAPIDEEYRTTLLTMFPKPN